MNSIDFEKDRVDSITQIDQTKNLSDKVIELRNLEDQVAASENHTKDLKEKAKQLSNFDIPKMMQEMNVTKLKLKDGYLIECEKKTTQEIIKLLNFYKLRSKVDFIDLSEKYVAAVISLEKFKEMNGSNLSKGSTTSYQEDPVYIDPRNDKLGAKIISKLENIHLTIKKLNLKIEDKKIYYGKSFELGIPQINLNKLKDKIFGIENNLDELNGIDFKKGCYVGQENTSRIKLRNKLRRRILPVQKITGEISENDIIKYKDTEVGKIMIDKPYSFALVKVVDPNLKEFSDSELMCGKSKVKILKPEWI